MDQTYPKRFVTSDTFSGIVRRPLPPQPPRNAKAAIRCRPCCARPVQHQSLHGGAPSRYPLRSMKRYTAPRAESDSDLFAWLAASPTDLAVTALLALLMLFVLWQLARAIRRTPPKTARPPRRRMPEPTRPRTRDGAQKDETPEWLARERYAPPLPCRWKRDRWRSRPAIMTRWVCSECGGEGFSADAEPPKECKRHLRAHQL